MEQYRLYLWVWIYPNWNVPQQELVLILDLEIKEFFFNKKKKWVNTSCTFLELKMHINTFLNKNIAKKKYYSHCIIVFPFCITLPRIHTRFNHYWKFILYSVVKKNSDIFFKSCFTFSLSEKMLHSWLPHS